MDSCFDLLKSGMKIDWFLTNTPLSLHKMLIVGITYWIVWYFCQPFGHSFWRHPFTTDDLLLSKWWNVTISPNLFRWRNIYFQLISFFWINYSFKCYLNLQTFRLCCISTRVMVVVRNFHFFPTIKPGNMCGCTFVACNILWTSKSPVSEGGLTGKGLFTGCFKECVGLYITGGMLKTGYFDLAVKKVLV